MLIAAFAFGTRAAAGDERHRYSLANKISSHITSDSHDHACELVSWHMRKLPNIWVVAAPAMPIAAAQPGRFNLNDGSIRFRRWLWNCFQRDAAAKLVIDNCFHLPRRQCRAL